MKDKLAWVAVATALILAWRLYELHDSVDKLQRTVNSMQNSGGNAVASIHPSLVRIQENQRSMVGALSYIELVTEGIARNNGLPIERARDAFKKLPGNPPPGWHWNGPWETSTETKTAVTP